MCFMIVGIINQNSDISIMKHRKDLFSYKVCGIWRISLERWALSLTLAPLNGGLDCLFGGFGQYKIGSAWEGNKDVSLSRLTKPNTKEVPIVQKKKCTDAHYCSTHVLTVPYVLFWCKLQPLLQPSLNSFRILKYGEDLIQCHPKNTTEYPWYTNSIGKAFRVTRAGPKDTEKRNKTTAVP